jgi:single-stranded DNA-binding protein
MTRGIEAAMWGQATRDAEVRQSKAGNEFAIVNLMTQDGSTGEDGKPVTTFTKVLAFSQHVNAARQIKRGDRVYCEGQLSASIWKTNDGEPRLDLTIKAFKLERTGIGKNRPPREAATSSAQTGKPAPRDRADWQAPPDGAFDAAHGDDIGF